MIIEGKGNLLTEDVEALVNTVNTVGVMGKGVALQFRQAFPPNFRAYQLACKQGEVMLGKMFVTRTGMLHPALIINFPTKQHWRGQAHLEHIQSGLADLINVVRQENIKSLAMPPLGCGLGGLRWNEVRPLIEQAFAALPEVEVRLYAPEHAILTERVVRTECPPMNVWRAALISLVGVYSELAFEASHLEAQKMLYFLVEAGEPLERVQFSKGPYGPYDEKMKFGLRDMEGHYIYGFGDGKRLDPVSLASGALAAAQTFLREATDTQQRIERVADLIHGFETPYGLELLASIHWVATREDEAARLSPERAVEQVHAWTERKRTALRARDLKIAWERLHEQGWLEQKRTDTRKQQIDSIAG